MLPLVSSRLLTTSEPDSLWATQTVLPDLPTQAPRRAVISGRAARSWTRPARMLAGADVLPSDVSSSMYVMVLGLPTSMLAYGEVSS